MALQENDDRQELENDVDYPIYPRSGRRGQLDHSQTQELEDLMVENQQLQERLKTLDDENVGLQHTVTRQKEEIVALQDLNDKTGSKFEEEGKDTKTRLHVWKDKVSLLQKQMRDDKALSDMLSKEQRLRCTLEKRLEDASERLKEAREEIVRLHEELSRSEQQKQQHEKAYADACHEMEELRIMSEADRQAAERQAQELNDQIMMMTPGSSLDGAFSFDSPLHKNSVSLPAGQDLLSQMQMIDDEAEEEEGEAAEPEAELLQSEQAKAVWESEKESLTAELAAQRATAVSLEKALTEERRLTESLQSELQATRSTLQTAGADAEKAKAVWESEKESLTAELAAQRATAVSLEKALTEERRLTESLQSELQATRSTLQTAGADAEKAKAVWESEKESLTAELAAQRATAVSLEKALTEERLSANQTPESATNESVGFKLAGASPTKAPAADSDRTAELESQVVELESELAKAKRLLQRFQDEREQSSWSSIVNSFMCAANR